MKKKYTLKLEDKGQDFLEIDVYENGVIRGYNIMFSDDRLSCFLIASKGGEEFYEVDKISKKDIVFSKYPLYIYIKKTGTKDPLPWKADFLKYKIIDLKVCKK